jgi:aryl-alcohol dehydrogenase-like predicted oxidoreductase
LLNPFFNNLKKSKVNYRRLGKTDLTISEIGFGCQSIAGGLYYKNNKESMKTLLEAFDSGVNFFDTSDHYSQGESESLIGKVFKEKREKIIIGTKAGTLYSTGVHFILKLRPLLRPVSNYIRSMKIPLHLMRAKQKRSDFSPGYLIRSVERSLKRLQTDYIDLFQLHKPSGEILEKDEFIETLEKLKKQGKIRYYGISCAFNEDAYICLNYPSISSIQITINLLDRKSVKEILTKASDKKVGVIARNPRAQGHLTNELSDIMAETYVHNQKESDEKKEKAKKFQFLVKPNRTLSQAALRFALNFKEVSTVIPRWINRSQLKESLDTLNSPQLTDEDFAKIYSI